ncbi:MAG: ATP-binding protein [Acidobacteriota bacterium]|nr:ATP-binding protein [Acidobacteriota bacterium]
MKLIKQIEIKSFRSFGNRKQESYKLIKCNDLNIISGANDSGKSNVLRALNLFFNNLTDPNVIFNFDRDFHRIPNPDEDDVKVQLVTIKIWFDNQKNKGKNVTSPVNVYLPAEFWVSKTWKRTSTYTNDDIITSIEREFEKEKGENFENFLNEEIKDKRTLKSVVKASLQRQLTDFLHSIQFHYVPAIKDRDYFSHLYGELQKTLWKSKKSTVERKKIDFEQTIQAETNQLMEEFKSSISASSIIDFNPVFELPSDLINLFRALVVQTGNVDLTLRGDGFQAKLIPEILHFISQKELTLTSASVRSGEKSKKYFIWGFEEPENSYEYKNAQLLAEKFKTRFIENAQIFITTHSFNFVSLESENVSKYRVWKDNKFSSSKIAKIKSDPNGRLNFEGNDFKSDEKKLEEELGVFYLNSHLDEIYKKQEEDLKAIQEKLSSINKPILYTEGNNVNFIKKAKEFFGSELELDIESLGGKNELKHYFSKFAQTGYDRHKMFFVFDCDAVAEYEACLEKKTKLLLPFIFRLNSENNVEEIKKGIENLFDTALFDNESKLFSVTETKRDGNILSRNRSLRKSEFQKFIIEERNIEEDFYNFSELFKFIEENLNE